jgi:hypothetical protein
MNSTPLNHKTLDTSVPPWVSSPYSLLTWWDMEQLSEFHMYSIGILLGQLKFAFQTYQLESQKNKNALPWIPTYYKKEISKNLRTIRKQCEQIGLTVALACIEEGIYDLRQEFVKPETIGKIYDDLSETIRREMQSINFFYMPQKQTRFYRQYELFGSKVAVKFPSLEFDIIEAGNCFAMGRSTACVFHLMRIMEMGVQEFGNKLGVVLASQKNWQNILDEINKAIKGLPKTPESVALSQTSAHLYNVKVAWRNQVMHPHDKYTLDEAEDLINHVKAFMKTLAKIMA